MTEDKKRSTTVLLEGLRKVLREDAVNLERSAIESEKRCDLLKLTTFMIGDESTPREKEALRRVELIDRARAASAIEQAKSTLK